ncbi:MAG: hypothetical protein FWH19_01140 [Treponema sp.]|nr:hypothetical protein [Treponema sp.]
MNRSRIIGFAAAAALLGFLALAVYNIFEINPRTRRLPPSREGRVNEYLALDRWLEYSGIGLRTESSAGISDISGAGEKQIFIQASLFRWTDEAVKYLVSWIEDGGHLFLVLDYYGDPSRDHFWEWHKEGPMLLLELFGIEANMGRPVPAYYHESDAPSFDRRVSFSFKDTVNEQALVLTDHSGETRFVQIRPGQGKLTLSGRPLFLFSPNLERAPNARLAWAIFAEQEDGAWFFVRGLARVQGIFGSLFRQGNMTVLVISVLLLLFVSFWAVIPVFGLVKGDDEKPQRPLRERFLAEGRFLKSHGALDFYRAAYIREIKRRLGRKEGLNTDEEIEKRIFELLGRPVAAPSPQAYFQKMVIDYKTILERI